MVSKKMMKFRCLVCLVAILTGTMVCYADSQFFAPVTGTADDILTDYSFWSYDVSGNQVVGWANGSLQLLDKSGKLISNFGTPTGYSGYNSFTTIDPSGNSVWVGFTTNGDDRIYQVDYATGAWTHKATLASNFDMEFYGGNAYVSGLNSTDWSAPTSIWLLDTSGSDNHDKLVEMSGNSAGLAFDSAGNAYYASYSGSDSTLYKWDAADIAGAIGAGYLTYDDGTKLSDLELGAYDTDVDDADNIIFNGNGSYSYTAIWNGTAGDGINYDYLGIGCGTYGDWFTMIDSQGDVTTESGYLYQTDCYYYGIAAAQVPEPATIALLGLGGLLLRRRRG